MPKPKRARKSKPGWASAALASLASLLSDTRDVVAPLFDEEPAARRGGQLVFVYGTLRRGKNNHHRMHGAESVGEATVRDHAKTTRVGGPAIVPSRGHEVRGELYRIDARTLRDVDQYESPEFERRPVRLADGRTAWAYVYRTR